MKRRVTRVRLTRIAGGFDDFGKNGRRGKLGEKEAWVRRRIDEKTTKLSRTTWRTVEPDSGCDSLNVCGDTFGFLLVEFVQL
jgi:hypothetical protein